MRSYFQRALGLFVVGLACHCPAPIYMEYGDIKGDVTDDGHKDWIELLSLSGTPQAGTLPAGIPSSLTLIKRADKASPKLLEACARGQAAAESRIVLLESQPSPVRYLEIRLEDVFIAEFNTRAGGNSEPVPTESLALNFSRVTWTYTLRHPLSRLPRERTTTTVDFATNTAEGETVTPSFPVVGIRRSAGQIELQWPGQAGRTYNIYSVASLTGPFALVGQITATTDGPLSHTTALLPGTMFFAVEDRP